MTKLNLDCPKEQEVILSSLVQRYMTDSPPLVEHNRNLPLLPDLHNKPLQPQTIRDVGLESMGIGKSDTWKISLPFLHINMEEAGFAVQAMQSVCIYCRLDSKATARQAGASLQTVAVLFIYSKTWIRARD